MRFRKTVVAIATAASLVVIPTTAYAGGSKDYNDDCRDHKVWKDYRYAPPCECDDKDHDHRDHDRDKDRDKDWGRKDEAKPTPTKTTTVIKYTTKAPAKQRQATYEGRVLKTS